MLGSLTSNEKEIIKYLRSLKPYERMEIVASKDGLPDNFFVTRTEKIILNSNGSFNCK